MDNADQWTEEGASNGALTARSQLALGMKGKKRFDWKKEPGWLPSMSILTTS